MNEGTMAQTPNPPPSQPPLTGSGERPRLGWYVSLAGGIIVFVSAIVYLAFGNATAGVIGVILVIAFVVFVRRGRLATDKKDTTMNGMIAMVIGFIVMAATTAYLNSDLVVILGGFLMAMGGIAITAGK